MGFYRIVCGECKEVIPADAGCGRIGGFLVKEYGRKAVADLLRKIGIRLQDSERLLEAAWREALLKKKWI